MENHVMNNFVPATLLKKSSVIMTLNLRSVTKDDTDFLFSVYASTRMDEMKLVDWSEEQKNAFLHMQFDAQTKHYAAYYPDATYEIIEQEGVAVGRLITENRGDHFLLMDIAL